MTSSQPFASSPLSPNSHARRRSKYTYKHLSTLAQSATNCPLRVIAHIDLDAFYAQCETVRLGIDPSKPLAVQQWQGLIAINYPAREFGLSRHVTITEAKEKCPEIICQHVATWKEGDVTWSYSDNAFKEIATRKVSLDPYRIQSRKILASIKDSLPTDTQRVEKASIDEVFLDLSAQVHGILLERFPELKGPPPYDDPAEPLPRPPITALDWAADALVDLDNTQWEEDDPDWDDICILIASEIVRDVRKRIFTDLQFTCSAGIARNKMIAKLGSAYKKPNAQTVVRNRAVQHFLSGFKFTKIRNLGGKLGDEVVAAFNTDSVIELLNVPVEQLRKQLGDDTGNWLFGILRGEDSSEVNPRTQMKSMLSAKSFRPSINSFEVACKWLRIFVADIFSRLVEEGVLENRRRPKTINLHHRQGQSTKSRSAPIPLGKTISEDGLFDLAKNLMAHVVVDGRAWPCANLSLSVGGFEDGITGNKGIGGFLLHGEEAKVLKSKSNDRGRRTDAPPDSKRRRIEEPQGIAKFFGGTTTANNLKQPDFDQLRPETDSPFNASLHEQDSHEPGDEDADDQDDDLIDLAYSRVGPEQHSVEHAVASPRSPSSKTNLTLHQSYIDTYLCDRCKETVPLDDKVEHDDFHFAQDLQNQQSSPQARIPPKPTVPLNTPNHSAKGTRSKRGRPALSSGAGSAGDQKGQKKLTFGK